jgi:hypothetical protein
MEQRHSITAPDRRIERVDLARHVRWREPFHQSNRIDER